MASLLGGASARGHRAWFSALIPGVAVTLDLEPLLTSGGSPSANQTWLRMPFYPVLCSSGVRAGQLPPPLPHPASDPGLNGSAMG